MKVIVSCSTKFHAFALVEQLERFSLLDTFYTSYAYQKNSVFRKIAKRVDKEQINPSKIKTNIVLAILIKALPRYSRVWNNLFDRWVAHKIKNSNADVFIGWSGMSFHALNRAKKRGLITILERGSSHISYQNQVLTEEYKKYNLPSPVDPRVEKTEIKEYSQTDYISIPSTFVKKSFLEMGINENKLVQNPYGTSTHFTKVSGEQPDEVFRVLYLGSLMIRKGLSYLFDALDLLNIDEKHLEVLFVGTVTDELKALVEKRKKSNWHFLGHVNHYSLSSIISKSDIAVHPSLEEGLSTVIPQIMSCGVPVIASTNTGGEDVITTGVNGFIVPIRDPGSIATIIDRLYANPKELETIKNQLSQNSDFFTWDKYGQRYMRALNDIYEKN